MSLEDQLGFASPLVLMKIGHDLRDRLSSSVEAPLPASFTPLIERIGEQGQPADVITLRSGDYRWAEDDPLS